MKRRVVMVALSLIVGCGAGAAPSPASNAAATATPPPSAEASGTLPTPYTAGQIRDRARVGRRLDWNVEAPGRGREVRSIAFTKVGPDGADVEMVTLDETGHQLGDTTRAHATWEELRDHAAFPAAATTVAKESITVPAGTYACTVYTVTLGTKTTKFWFAAEMPGPPVKMETTEGGKLTEKRELFRVLEGA